jgi:hypothetical protein
MSARATVVASPAFAGGRLQTFNRLLLAAARGGGTDAVEFVLDEHRASERDLVLRVLNAHGDPVGLPAPHRGVIRDERERALWSAALLDVMPPTLAAAGAVETFLPRAGASLSEAATELWSILWPELRVRTIARGDAPAADDGGAAGHALVWIGAHQRKALDELGVSAEEIVSAGEDAAARYRPSLQGELAAGIESLRSALEGPLAELRPLAHEVDPTLVGAWSRMDRAMRRGVADFTVAAERCLDNHSGIRRSRWHAAAQALRPAEEPQESGMGLLAAVALFGLRTERRHEYVERLRQRTSLLACDSAAPLFLDC